MSWNYSGNPSTSDKDAVRFLSGRTDDCVQLVSDEEILFTLTQETNVYLAAAMVLDSLAAKFSGHTDQKVGDISVSASQKADAFRKRAEELRRKFNNNGAEFFVGGLSVSGNEVLDRNTDAVQPKFRVGQDDHPDVREDRSDTGYDPSRRCY